MGSDPTPLHIPSLREIFVAALEFPTDAERQAWLERACAGDPEKLRRVNELLKASQRPQSNPLDALVDQLGADESAILPLRSDAALDISTHPQIGPYKLLELLGEGGMGTVYMAQQLAPIKRKVAFKVIKPGMDSREVIARFEAERQALSMMDHPHIARVLDAGTTDAGRPYFVMELVRGTPITEYCRDGQLALRERLALFLDVCHAVQHAHQKGIIHRDLKPSNILVTLYDGRPVVKVIDFGLAKALDQELTERTLFTQFAQIVGTPMYMSPEQAEMSGLDIDTRSDVYALGVLLYELLTDTTPFNREEFTRAGFDGMRRIIREQDPPRPSHRLSTLVAGRGSTLHNADPLNRRQLAQALRRELDWVVMRALEKDRTRRYQSAGELAADILRYLQDEPVEACPPSTGYRLRKIVRRYRGLLAMSAVILLLLMAGLVITSELAIRASRAEHDAIVAQDAAEQTAEERRQLLYASDMLLASEAWRHNDARQMAERLLRHLPQPGERDLRGFEWNYLWKQQDVPGARLAEQPGAVYDLKCSPDGKCFAAVGADSMLRLFDVETGDELRAIPTAQGEINGVAFSPDGARVATVGDDGSLCVFNRESGQEQWRVKAFDSMAFQAAFTPDGKEIVCCGRDPDVRVWDAVTGESRGLLNQHTRNIEYLAMSPEGLVASGDRMSNVTVWEARARKLRYKQENDFGAAISALAISSQNVLVYGTVDGHLCASDAATGARLARLRIADGVQSLAFGPDGTWMAVGDRSGNVQVIPFEDGQWNIEAARSWPAHGGRVYALMIAPDGRRIISSGADGRIVVWQPFATASYLMLDCGVPAVDVAAVDSETFVVGTRNGITHYDRRGNRLGDLISGSGGWWVAVATDVRRVYGTCGPHLVAWDLDTGREAFRLEQTGGTMYGGPQATRDGRVVATIISAPNGDSSLELIDGQTGRELARMSLESWASRAVSPDGRWLMIDHNNDLQVVDLQERRFREVWSAHRGAVRGIAISGDGRRVASVSADRMLKLWSFPAGVQLNSVLAHRTEGLCVAMTSDGRRIATGGADRMLRLWDGETLQLVWEFPPPTGVISRLCFLGDNQRLVCLSGEQHVVVLDGAPASLSPRYGERAGFTSDDP